MAESMSADPIAEKILHATREAGKTYSFNDAHKADQPLEVFFQHSDEGLVLFVIFFSQACQYSLCQGCTLPSTSSLSHVGFRDLMKQVDSLFVRPDVCEKSAAITKVIASNQGSMLDEATFSTTALIYFIAELNVHVPRLRTLCLETRVEYVDVSELGVLARALQESPSKTNLEIAVGFEAFDDQIRNRLFLKGFGLKGFERLVEKLAKHSFRLKCYFMLKPVAGMSDAAAVKDIHEAIDYLSELATRHQVRINLHLNPTYVARGTKLAEAFARGEYTPPKVSDAARAVLHARGKNLTVFVGLNDEGLAVPGGSFAKPEDAEILRLLESFNRTQDYTLLEKVPLP